MGLYKFFINKIDFNPLLKMDEAVQLRLQLKGNFVPSIVDRVALVRFIIFILLVVFCDIHGYLFSIYLFR